MKMKEQNAWLSLVGFIQVIFIAIVGYLIAESEKSTHNELVVTASVTIATLGAIIVIYWYVFKRAKK